MVRIPVQPYGVSSLSAFVRVAKPDDPDDDLFVDLVVPEVYPGVDPIDSLQTLVDIWGGCGLTDFTEFDGLPEIAIHPNPARDQLTFTIPKTLNISSVSIVIYNHLGQQVDLIQIKNMEEISLNTSDYSPGIYFYKVYSAKKMKSSGKFVIQ